MSANEVQGKWPQNVPLLHVDYFELKFLKSDKEGHSDLPLPPGKQETDFHVKFTFRAPGGQKASLVPEIGNSGLRKLHK